MKKRIYFVVIMLCAFWGCDDEVGFLDTGYAAYDPSEFSVRHIPVFQEETGWSLYDFWDLRAGLPEEVEDRYLMDWDVNWKHYQQRTDWITTNLQGVAGTYPLWVTLHDVSSKDGGDPGLFKRIVKMRGDGTLEIPADTLPAGTYLLSMKVKNESHVAIIPDCFTVRVIGAPKSFVEE